IDSSDNVYLVGTTQSFRYGENNIVLVKNPKKEQVSGVPRIPGYNWVLLVSITSIISLLRLKKRFRILKNNK
ncbi:MAG: hypothetical protein ACFFDF_23500, partial [Candidatus Odinarchaeota archaeon]